jgi:hypothetical protein
MSEEDQGDRRTLEDRREDIGQKVHSLSKKLQETVFECQRLDHEIKNLKSASTDVTRIRLSLATTFAIVVCTLSVAGLLYTVKAGIDNLAVEVRMNNTLQQEKNAQFQKQIDEEIRARQLQFYEFKEAQKGKKE